MQKRHAGYTMVLIVLCVALWVGTVDAEGPHGPSKHGEQYAVTITNLARGQVITPPVVIVHLLPKKVDWRSPVAEVVISPIR
jgi:hypothetical protein